VSRPPSDNSRQPVSTVRLGVGEAHPADLETWLEDSEWKGRLTLKTPDKSSSARVVLLFSHSTQDNVITHLSSVYTQLVSFMDACFAARLGFLLRWLGTRQDKERYDVQLPLKQIVPRADGDKWEGEMQFHYAGVQSSKLYLGRFNSREAVTDYATQVYEQLIAYMEDRYKDRLMRLLGFLADGNI